MPKVDLLYSDWRIVVSIVEEKIQQGRHLQGLLLDIEKQLGWVED
jgi:hypothetical protein